jgi:hypothetical protein
MKSEQGEQFTLLCGEGEEAEEEEVRTHTLGIPEHW